MFTCKPPDHLDHLVRTHGTSLFPLFPPLDFTGWTALIFFKSPLKFLVHHMVISFLVEQSAYIVHCHAWAGLHFDFSSCMEIELTIFLLIFFKFLHRFNGAITSAHAIKLFRPVDYR